MRNYFKPVALPLIFFVVLGTLAYFMGEAALTLMGVHFALIVIAVWIGLKMARHITGQKL